MARFGKKALTTQSCWYKRRCATCIIKKTWFINVKSENDWRWKFLPNTTTLMHDGQSVLGSIVHTLQDTQSFPVIRSESWKTKRTTTTTHHDGIKSNTTATFNHQKLWTSSPHEGFPPCQPWPGAAQQAWPSPRSSRSGHFSSSTWRSCGLAPSWAAMKISP